MYNIHGIWYVNFSARNIFIFTLALSLNLNYVDIHKSLNHINLIYLFTYMICQFFSTDHLCVHTGTLLEFELYWYTYINKSYKFDIPFYIYIYIWYVNFSARNIFVFTLALSDLLLAASIPLTLGDALTQVSLDVTNSLKRKYPNT